MAKYISIRVNSEHAPLREYYKAEHKISYWLYKANYSRTEIANLLEISTITLKKYLKYPKKYFTAFHIERIANALDVPVIDVFHVVYNGQLP